MATAKPKPDPKPKRPKKPGGMPRAEVINVPQPDPRAYVRDTAIRKIEEYGLENILDDILDQVPLSHIAIRLEVANSALLRWMGADEERSRRILDARRKTAQNWEEMAEKALAEARNPFELAKAKELAHHYRWRAACIAPKQYGEQKGKDGDKPKEVDQNQFLAQLASHLPD